MPGTQETSQPLPKTVWFYFPNLLAGVLHKGPQDAFQFPSELVWVPSMCAGSQIHVDRTGKRPKPNTVGDNDIPFIHVIFHPFIHLFINNSSYCTSCKYQTFYCQNTTMSKINMKPMLFYLMGFTVLFGETGSK